MDQRYEIQYGMAQGPSTNDGDRDTISLNGTAHENEICVPGYAIIYISSNDDNSLPRKNCPPRMRPHSIVSSTTRQTITSPAHRARRARIP